MVDGLWLWMGVWYVQPNGKHRSGRVGLKFRMVLFGEKLTAVRLSRNTGLVVS